MCETAAGLIGKAEVRLNFPGDIAKMVEVVPANEGKFRTVISKSSKILKQHQAKMFELEI